MKIKILRELICGEDPKGNIYIGYSPEKVAYRFSDLIEIYKDTIEPNWAGIKLNRGILLHCIQSYFLDLLRTKIFHEIKLADEHKIAGFLMKWISKLKPIQVLNNDPKEITKKEILVNEFFAIYAGFNVFSKISFKKISTKFALNLLYTLHFRSSDGMIFSSLMYLLEKACCNETP